MSNLMLTIILASLLTTVAIALFSIGRILQGKSSIKPGGCGIDPTKKRDESCGDTQTCILCEPPPKSPKQKALERLEAQEKEEEEEEEDE